MENVGFLGKLPAVFLLGKALFVKRNEETEPSSHKQVDRGSEMYHDVSCHIPNRMAKAQHVDDQRWLQRFPGAQFSSVRSLEMRQA